MPTYGSDVCSRALRAPGRRPVGSSNQDKKIVSQHFLYDGMMTSILEKSTSRLGLNLSYFAVARERRRIGESVAPQRPHLAAKNSSTWCWFRIRLVLSAASDREIDSLLYWNCPSRACVSVSCLFKLLCQSRRLDRAAAALCSNVSHPRLE